MYSLSIELHTNVFEMVPVQLNRCKDSERRAKCVKDREYQKNWRLVETESDKQARLKNASEHKKGQK